MNTEALASPSAPAALHVLPVAEVAPLASGSRWLVDQLWAEAAVGVIGGAPKCCKTWLALDLAVSVATGTAALGRFDVATPGPVLLYGAEDSPAHLRRRVEDLTTTRDLDLRAVDLRLILTPSLRLDEPSDVARLDRTIEEHQPRLLILDPLVRLHRTHENLARTMSAILGDLRALQRRHGVAIILVHHLRKRGAAREVEGQSLRGSGDLHAWGDSNLYLRRRGPSLLLTVEHRSDAAPAPMALELITEPTPHLEVRGDPNDEGTGDERVRQQLVAALDEAGGPVAREVLRLQLRVRNATLGEALRRLREAGRIEQTDRGYALREHMAAVVPVPVP